MQKQKTIYHVIVDKSGSMSDCIDQTISGFNEQVRKIRDIEKEYPNQLITMGLTTFNHEVNHHFFQTAPNQVQPLNGRSYRPDGSTALLDAIGTTVSVIKNEIEREKNEFDTTAVIVILTDGYENSSTLFKLEDIRKMISGLEETGKWTFSFLGATLDAVDVAEAMSIKRSNSFAFEKQAMKSAVWDRLSVSMGQYMLNKEEGKSQRDFFKK